MGEEDNKSSSDVSDVVSNLKNQTTEKPNVEVEQDTDKKVRKPRKKKEPETPPFDMEDASSLVAIPFALWGKPLNPDEQHRLGLVAGRWLDKRCGMLAEYSVDIALAICALEIILKRTDILSKLISPPPDGQATDAE